MSQGADERTGEAAQERDAVERHFARSILAMLTVTPDPSYGNGFVPLGDAAAAVLLSQQAIEAAARAMAG